MDVRCEKCQTEYELDESRLKPGGVTVKCTNCGHMFKIRKRTPTNVGMQTVQDAAPPGPRPEAAPARPQRQSSKNDVPSALTDSPSGPNSERQWMVRLENGEQKTCRELATLQQWIVAGVASRESLISRSGKTWKRLGDITELGQYFVIADEARAQRAARPTNPKPAAPTMLGTGAPQAAASSGEADEDLEGRTTGNFRARPKTAPPHPPPQPAPKVNPLAQTEISGNFPAPPKRPPTNPPPPPLPKPTDGRQTAAWASSEVKQSESMAAMPQGPRGGKLASIPQNEPAFSGKIRMTPGDEASFDTGRVRQVDDDDDLMPPQRGSRAGMWIALLALLVIGGAAGAVYMFVFNQKKQQAKTPPPPADAATVAQVADAAAITPTPVVDAAAPPAVASPLDAARSELAGDVEARMKGAGDALTGKDDAQTLAMRARLELTIAQSMTDRAGLADKAEGDKLRKDAKQLVLDAAPLAQKAQKAGADDPSANLAMADVLRLQGKTAKDIARYLDKAKAGVKDDKELARSIALCDALTSSRDGKLDDAAKTLAAIDGSGDNRIAFQTALVAFMQNKVGDAKPLVQQILATSADHDAARALSKKLETAVAKTDPLPPEDGQHKTNPPPSDNGGGGGGGDYDSLLAKANKLAESNCTKAMDLFGKALEQKPTGVEALTGMGYCYLDAKQFASAFSKFRAALAVSPRYEPALGGVAETYQRQGNKEQAIAAWHNYLDVIPNSPKAKKQLEILGDTGGDKPPPPPPQGSDQSPPPAPQPAAGSGSAS
jgi:predicted Zn finger-like uncharacterized protein